MNKQIVYTKSAPEPIGPYSQAVKISSDDPYYIYTSGQVAIDSKTGNMIEGDIKAQTRQVMENLKAILRESGCDFSRVVKTTVFLKDMNDFTAMNDVYAQYLGDSKPARSTIEVVRLPKDALIEIEAIAYI